MIKGLSAILLVVYARVSLAFNFAIDPEKTLDLELIDQASGIGPIQTLHNGDTVEVSVVGISWIPAENSTSSTNLTWSTFLDGALVQSGTIDLSEEGQLLPSSIGVGEIVSPGSGSRTITVTLTLDEVDSEATNSYQSFESGVSLIPIIIILFLAVTTHLVEISLFSGIFVGACIVTGTVKQGFFTTLDTYILDAIANVDHAYVYIFTFSLSGLVGMIMKSGGFVGFTRTMSRFATSPRAGQMVAYISGLLIFFDDYANTLIVGGSMRPLTDMLFVSREKLAFLVDATSAPVASITPISSWIGFEIGLIQDELNKIKEQEGEENVWVPLNGLTVFLETIQFRYYPFFMLLLIPTLIMLNRDLGPMLIAERKTQVFQRADGGDGGTSGGGLVETANQPLSNTPGRIWNMIIPVCILVILILVILIESGEEPGEEQSLIDKLENSDSYSALLFGTMGAVWITMILYHLQFKTDGENLLWPTPNVLKQYVMGRFKKEDDNVPKVKPILNFYESVESFLSGMAHVFPATVVLTLAWASGSIMNTIGTDRLFADLISDNLSPGSLPTLTFVISFLMAMATGTSWGTMAIMFPLVTVPTYNVSDGNSVVFYSTLAGILSGSVAGDHASPISDTTILSALASQCNLIEHVRTQMPYALWMVVFSILIGTLPVGYEAYPTGVGFLFGYILILLLAFAVCRPIVSQNGNFDIFTEIFLRFNPNHYLHELKLATAEAYAAGKGTDISLPFFSKKKFAPPDLTTKGDEMLFSEDEKGDGENVTENKVVEDIEVVEQAAVVEDKKD